MKDVELSAHLILRRLSISDNQPARFDRNHNGDAGDFLWVLPATNHESGFAD